MTIVCKQVSRKYGKMLLYTFKPGIKENAVTARAVARMFH